MPPKKNLEVVIVIESPEQPILNEAVVAQAMTYFHIDTNSEEHNTNNSNNHHQQLEQLLATSLGISDSFTVSSIDRDTVDFIIENLTFAASCHSNYLLLQQQLQQNENNNNNSQNTTSSSMIMTPKKTFRFLTLMFELRDSIHRGDLESAKKQLKAFCASEIVAFSRESALQKAHEDQIRLQQNLYSTIGIVSTAEKQLLAMESTGTVGSGAGLNNTANNNNNSATALPSHLASLGVPGLNIAPTSSSPLQPQSQQQQQQQQGTAFSPGTNATAASLQQQQQKDSIQSLLNYAPVPSLRAMVTYLNTTVANNNNNNLFNTSFVGGLPDGQGGFLIGGQQQQRNADGTNGANKGEGTTNATGAAKKGKKGQQVDPNENQAPPPLIPSSQLYFSTSDLGHIVDFVANGLFQNWKLFYGAFGNSVGLFNDDEESLQSTNASSTSTMKTTTTTTILAPIVPVARPPPLRFAQSVSHWEAADASRRKAVTDELVRLQEQEKHDLEVEAQERAAKAAAEERQRQEEEAAKLFFERHGTDLAVQHVQKELQSDIQQKHAALLARIARLEEVYRIQI